MPTVCRQLVIFATLALGSMTGAWAATPDALDETAADAKAVPLAYSLGTELVVRNWILCTTQPFAESIARAWPSGPAAVLDVYTELAEARSCGQFPEMRVILLERLYESGPAIDNNARVFSASVKIGDGWPTGYVVFVGLPDQ
jgi:hypothetical protein